MCVLAVVGLLLTRHLIRTHRARREQAERERMATEMQLQDSIKAGDTLKSEIDSEEPHTGLKDDAYHTPK